MKRKFNPTIICILLLTAIAFLFLYANLICRSIQTPHRQEEICRRLQEKGDFNINVINHLEEKFNLRTFLAVKIEEENLQDVKDKVLKFPLIIHINDDTCDLFIDLSSLTAYLFFLEKPGKISSRAKHAYQLFLIEKEGGACV